MTDDKVAMLRSIPLLEGLGQDSLEQILEHASEFEVEAGHVLIHPERPGEGVFILEEGSVRVDLPTKRFELGPGEVLGELALLTEEARHTARVTAVSAVKGLALRREDFDDLLAREPALAVLLLKVVATRLAARDRT